MPQGIDREGVFRGQITSYELNEAKSGAVGVIVAVLIDEGWNDNEWIDWRQYECEATGYISLIKKDGSDNDMQICALVEHAGWDGSFGSFVAQTWQPTPCQIVVKPEPPNDFHKDTRYRIAWINGYDASPLSGNVDSERARALDTAYGSRIRAIAGNVKRNAPAPSGKPPAPPVPAKRGLTREEVAEETAAVQAADDGIPF